MKKSSGGAPSSLGLGATQHFVFVHEDDDQADNEERDHQFAQKIVVATGAQHRDLHGLNVCGRYSSKKAFWIGVGPVGLGVLNSRNCRQSWKAKDYIVNLVRGSRRGSIAWPIAPATPTRGRDS
jgi:hypothetical protein